MPLSTLYTPRNNAYSLLTVPHAVGDGVLVVTDASPFGSPTPTFPIKVSCESAIMSVTGIIGNTLTIGAFLEGTTDVFLPINSVVDVRFTALDLTSIHDSLRSIIAETSYIHTQGVPASTWTINHNLDRFPSVTVVDSANEWVIGNVNYINTNSLQVSFGGAFGGKAYLN